MKLIATETISYLHRQTWKSELATNLVKLAINETNLGFLKISFPSQNVLKTDLKSLRILANLTNFVATSEIHVDKQEV